METYTKINPSAPLVMDDITLNIPRPVANADDYRNYAPYATYRLYLPFYGMFDLDSELLKGANTITIHHVIDWGTGLGKVMIRRGGGDSSNPIIMTAEASVVASVPLAQSSLPIDWGTAIAGTVKNVVGRFSTSEFEDALSDIASMYLDVNRQVSVSGTAGCFSQRIFENDAILICDYKTQVEKNHALFGDPLCKAVRLSDMTGFVKCLSFNMQSYNYLQAECDQVNQYLNGGCYIE